MNSDSKYGRSLQRLIEYFGKYLKQKSDQKVDYYRLVQIKNDEKLSNFSHETIVLGLKKSWILEAEMERLSDQRVRFKTLTLNNILLPSFELPFGSKQLWKIEASEVDALVKGEYVEIEKQLEPVSQDVQKEPASSPPMDFYVYRDDIEKLVLEKQIVIFCGAGLSAHAGYLSGNELKVRLAEEMDIDHSGMTLDKVAEAFAARKGEDQLFAFIINLFDKVKNPRMDLHLKLAKFGVTRFVTTNWDTLLEDAFEEIGQPRQIIVTPSQLGLIDDNKVGIFKIHGDFDHLEQMIITKKHYLSFSQKHKSMITRLESMLQNRSVLFLGYSVDDPDVRLILDSILEQIPLGKVSYAVFRSISPHEKDRLEKDYKIKVIQTELKQFVDSMSMRIG